MNEFTLEDMYGMTRQQYYVVTGITPDEMIRSLHSEVMVLIDHCESLRVIYRELSFTSDEGRRIARLISHITKKVAQKRAKIKDITENDL